MKLGTVQTLTKIKNIKPGMDYCEVVVEDIPYKLFGEYEDYIKYLNHRVFYETRPDMYQGSMIEVIANIAEQQIVQTVAETKGIKLIPDNSALRPICNVSLADIRPNDSLRDVIVYLSDYTVDSSLKATWLDMKVVDMKSKLYNVRYFTKNGAISVADEQVLCNLKGHYVKIGRLVRTQYGLQAETVILHPIEVVLAPEVAVAEQIINEAAKDDSALIDYITKYNYIQSLRDTIDVEPGFHLVRVATEIILIKSLANVTQMYSEEELVRAAVTSRGYLIDRKNDLSRVVLNVNRVTRSALRGDIALIDCLDVMSEHTSPLKRAYINVANFANFIVDERRGLVDEKEVIDSIMRISNQYGRLL